ncbi:HNH endonuclease [Massilia psychrophila]|nr:HNH endonuclease signature motif containing protein [Massilia psychrophila]
MNKMTMYWVAVASSLYPDTSAEQLITLKQIQRKHEELFKDALTQSLEQQLISWKRRYSNPKVPAMGGSRNRYLFRTKDGHTPDPSGGFRLYKLSDGPHDSTDKSSGPTCPPRDEVQEQFRYLVDWYTSSYRDLPFDFDNETDADLAEASIDRSDLPLTEKISLFKSRRGQGVFRTRVALAERNCRLTGTTALHFLTASHIKPWKHSTNVERLDGNNGLLLAPHVDRLFDKGFLTFNQAGECMIAPEAIDVCHQWHLSGMGHRPFSPEQEKYMEYHRKHVYRRWIPAT